MRASGWPGYYTESGALFASNELSVEGSSSGSHGLGSYILKASESADSYFQSQQICGKSA